MPRLGAASASVSISGLTPGAEYQFYFYSQAGGSGATNRHANFTFDGNTASLTANNAGAFISGTNYVQFTITPGGTTLNGSFEKAPGNSEAELNGFQIVQVTAIPEPSTCALIGGVPR